ncbi:MAG: hypothetical protein IFK91_08780 [Acidobacteria bacterium]|nr:hypothetical protein [Candidatus Sulfomarinibacter sp. MAG AM1]
MSQREFAHANNPGFACAESVLLLPFGRRSFLPAIDRDRRFTRSVRAW